jgi:porphobilinogen synthase
MPAQFPVYRPRRMRINEAARSLIRETTLTVADLIYPLFVKPGVDEATPIPSMPGQFQYTLDRLPDVVAELEGLGIQSVLLFGIPSHKDERGSEAYDDKGIIQEAVRTIKRHGPGLYVITDVCLCEYTTHGHCGIVDAAGYVLNDATLELLGKEAVSHARAGADMVAPSDMMDGHVAAIRGALDAEGLIDTPIMAYSAKFASAYYGPFRDAAGSTPQFGDRRAYQMDPANSDEAMREIQLDIDEGADVIIAKPAMAFGDIIRRAADTFHFPLCAYNVSGEYAMVKAAAAQGWIDERRIVIETLTGMKRAGAQTIITYHAKDAARWIAEDAHARIHISSGAE